MNCSLHIQVVGVTADEMIEEALRPVKEADSKIYIKVPVTKEGLKAIQILSSRGYGITATSIYSEIQAYLAIDAGASYVAPYHNCMDNLNIEVSSLIAWIVNVIESQKSSCKILGASYKNINQINQSLVAGGHTVTFQPRLLYDALASAPIDKAVHDFKSDWTSVFGDKTINEL